MVEILQHSSDVLRGRGRCLTTACSRCLAGNQVARSFGISEFACFEIGQKSPVRPIEIHFRSVGWPGLSPVFAKAGEFWLSLQRSEVAFERRAHSLVLFPRDGLPQQRNGTRISETD